MGDPTRFPEGMPAFIEKIHALGFKFGLFVAALGICVMPAA
jgi:hypothetical protein